MTNAPFAVTTLTGAGITDTPDSELHAVPALHKPAAHTNTAAICTILSRAFIKPHYPCTQHYL
jgi:hypothetical protein